MEDLEDEDREPDEGEGDGTGEDSRNYGDNVNMQEHLGTIMCAAYIWGTKCQSYLHAVGEGYHDIASYSSLSWRSGATRTNFLS